MRTMIGFDSKRWCLHDIVASTSSKKTTLLHAPPRSQNLNTDNSRDTIGARSIHSDNIHFKKFADSRVGGSEGIPSPLLTRQMLKHLRSNFLMQASQVFLRAFDLISWRKSTLRIPPSVWGHKQLWHPISRHHRLLLNSRASKTHVHLKIYLQRRMGVCPTSE